MDFVPLAATVALLWKAVDLAKLVRVKDVNAVVTQLVTWAAGVVLAFLLASTDFAEGIKIGGMMLAHLNAGSLILFGLSLGSSASVGYDLKRAIDRSDSAAMPALVTGAVPVTAPPPPTVTTPTRRGHRDAGQIGVLILLVVLILLFGGLGFAAHAFWIVVVLLLVAVLIGSVRGW